MFWLNTTALWNILDRFVTLDVFHPAMFWLNRVAPLNILLISATLDVTQLEMLALNELAPLNILLISVTFVVAQLDNDWVIAAHPWNVPFSVVTLVGRYSGTWVNLTHPLNASSRLVTESPSPHVVEAVSSAVAADNKNAAPLHVPPNLSIDPIRTLITAMIFAPASVEV